MVACLLHAPPFQVAGGKAKRLLATGLLSRLVGGNGEEKGVLSGRWFWLEIGLDLWALLCVGCCGRLVARDEEESVARALLWVGCWPSGEDAAATVGGESRLRVESRAIFASLWRKGR